MAFDGRLLAGVSVLAAIVEGGSFSRAAEVLGLSPSGVSRAVARLEARIGIRLVERTTRSVRLTDEGAQFYAQVAPLLEGIEEATAVASGSAHSVRGRLRVSVDPFFSHLVLAPRLVDFIDRFPNLTIDLITRDDLGDLIGEGFDVAIRFGPPPLSSLVARQLLTTRILTVAAPTYLERRGRPRHPTDLENHTCIQYRNPLTGQPFEWEFRRGQKTVPVKTTGPVLLTDVGTMLKSCLSGIGIAQVMALGVQDLLEKGQLIELFPNWPDETFPLYAVYTSRSRPAAKVRAFVEFCREIVGPLR
jgi:DNA-binding transcriptional LysR family regulator